MHNLIICSIFIEHWGDKVNVIVYYRELRKCFILRKVSASTTVDRPQIGSKKCFWRSSSRPLQILRKRHVVKYKYQNGMTKATYDFISIN